MAEVPSRHGGQRRVVGGRPRGDAGGGRGGATRPSGPRHPSDESAVRAWCSAVPQLSTASRPSGSVTDSCRLCTAYRSRASPLTRQRHGWLLWIDGAYPARAAALASAPVIVSTTDFPSYGVTVHPPPGARGPAGPQVPSRIPAARAVRPCGDRAVQGRKGG